MLHEHIQIRNNLTNKQKILDAARVLFAQQGFDGTTSKDIAQLAGCSEGLIFKYYENKRNIFKILVTEWFDSNMQTLKNLPQSTSLEDEIQLLLNWFVDNFTQRKDLHKIFLFQRFNVNFQNNFVRDHHDYLQERLTIITKRLELFKHNGELREDVDISQLCELFHGYIMVEILFRDLSLEQIKIKLQSFTRLIFNGLKNS